MKKLALIIALFLVPAIPAYAQLGAGGLQLQPIPAPVCHTIWTLGGGYTVVCE